MALLFDEVFTCPVGPGGANFASASKVHNYRREGVHCM